MATLFVGIDVAKDSLVIAVRPLGRHWDCPNTPQGCQNLVPALTALADSPTQIRVVLESTGGLELDAAIALQEAGLEVAVIKPERARHYAKATGQFAKTDVIDARLLAEFAEKVELTIYPLPSAEIRYFRDLLDRREQLVFGDVHRAPSPPQTPVRGPQVSWPARPRRPSGRSLLGVR